MNITELIGKTFIQIEGSIGGEQIKFVCSDGTAYLMHHSQDCCETVLIDDIVGDLEDLLDTPILVAEERTNVDAPPSERDKYPDSYTWTFYEFRTIEGSVTIKWYGASNGYYSERVDLIKYE